MVVLVILVVVVVVEPGWEGGTAIHGTYSFFKQLSQHWDRV